MPKEDLYSIAGIIKEKNEEESIIPAERASIQSIINLFIPLNKKTIADPRHVKEKANKPERIAKEK